MKYIISETKHDKYNAYQIIASEDAPLLGVKSGDYGGYVETKNNLVTDGLAWVFPTSVVLGNSIVSGNSVVRNGAILKNVSLNFNSSISDVYVEDTIFDNEIKIYGKPRSIVITDKCLTYNSITANKINDELITVGYSTFIGDINSFKKHLNLGVLSENDHLLLRTYIRVIDNRFKYLHKI